MELESWKEYFEVRLVSSVISSIEVSDEEECGISKHVVACEDEECLENWIKVESWISSWEVNSF